MEQLPEDAPQNRLDAALVVLAGSDLGANSRLLVDLGELLGRHAHTGSETDFGADFASPVIAGLPVRLKPGVIGRIAQAVGRVLLDPGEDEGIRATAAFVLGKTFDPGALASVARAVSAPATLSTEAGRQCGFAFDALWQECGPGGPPVDLDAVAAGFKALGVPWNDRTRSVAVNDL